MMATGLATGMSRGTACASGATPGGTNLDDISVATRGGRSSGSRRSAQQAALYHRICLMSDKNTRQEHTCEQPHVSTNLQLKQFHKIGYKDAKTWMERRLVGIRSCVPNWVATAMAGEW
jgi:hypothetical protein